MSRSHQPPEAVALLGFFLHGSAAAWASAGSVERVACIWLVLEGAFFALCNALALRMNGTRAFDIAPGPLTPERRGECWRRILSDPTQHPRDFVEGWFYRAARSTGPAGGRYASHGSAWSALATYSSSLLPGREGGARATADLPVRYEELRRADVNHWLATGLFEKALHELSGSERRELDVLVGALEAAVGSPLLDGPQADTPTPGVRSMRMATDNVQW
jgi:hypothetical protein